MAGRLDEAGVLMIRRGGERPDRRVAECRSLNQREMAGGTGGIGGAEMVSLQGVTVKALASVSTVDHHPGGISNAVAIGAAGGGCSVNRW